MEWKSAADALKQSRLQPIYTLVGTEVTLMQQFILMLRESMQTASQEEVALHRFYYEETGCEAALAECQTLSLFAEQSVIILEDCVALTSQAKGKHDLTSLESYIAQPVPERVFIVTCHAEKLDERKKIVKHLKKYPIVNCNTPKENEALKLVAGLAKQLQLSVDSGALAELWRRTQSITTSQRELEKLAAYTEGQVMVADVEQVTPTPPQDNVFRWIEGVLAGKLSQAFEALQDIQQSGYDTFALFSLMARQLRIMWFAKVLSSQGLGQREIAGRVGAHPYAVKMASEQAKGFSVAWIEELLCVIADTEFMVKSGRQDVGQALDWIVLSCSQTNARQNPTG